MSKPIKAPQITLQMMRLINRVTKSAAVGFNGGLNAYNLPTEVADGQATDMLNMWYRNGLTRLRPGVMSASASDGSKIAQQTALINRVKTIIANTTSPYIPTLFTNCNARGGGNEYESRNMLTPWVKQQFSPGGGDKTFKLADTQLDTDKDITIDYQAPVYNYVEHYTIPHGSTDPATGLPYVTFQNPSSLSFYKVTCDYTQGLISWYKTTSLGGSVDTTWTGFTDDATYNVMNNLTFTYAKTVYSTIPISACTMAAWFGGSLSGLGNGSCLVVAGNPAEPNKYWWSGVNDLTYWGADNFNSCGDSTDPFTAMAKANDELILFKASSVYGVTYNATQPTSTTIVYEPFPQHQIHPTIGCDCPDTVELIQNALTWLNSDGHIYRMVSYSNKDENNIVPISQNVEPILKNYSSAAMQAGTSCDTGNYYIVFIGNEAWAWDYSDTPFSTKATLNAAQMALAWFHWQFPSLGAITRAFYTAGTVYLNAGVYELNELYGTDAGLWFNAYVVSKDIDFGVPIEYKQVSQEWFTITCDDGTNLVFEMRDDLGALDYQMTITGASGITKTIKYNQTSDPTQHFRVALRRLTGDTGKFGISRAIMEATLGRDIAEA